jgi:hypothetical protein
MTRSGLSRSSTCCCQHRRCGDDRRALLKLNRMEGFAADSFRLVYQQIGDFFTHIRDSVDGPRVFLFLNLCTPFQVVLSWTLRVVIRTDSYSTQRPGSVWDNDHLAGHRPPQQIATFAWGHRGGGL